MTFQCSCSFLTHRVLNPCASDTCLTLSFYFSTESTKDTWRISALHPNSLSLTETQSEPIDRQRTVVRRGCSIYKHWLHLGRIPCPLACGYITRQQTIPWLQPSVLTENCVPASSFLFFFFYGPHICLALQDSHPSCFGGLGGCHDVLRKALSLLRSSNHQLE